MRTMHRRWMVLLAAGLGIIAAGTWSGTAGASVPSCTGTTGTLTCVFSYNGTDGTDGTVQTWVVPAGVTQVTVTAQGAQGGGGLGGLGGQARSKLTVTPGETLWLYVGGDGGVLQTDNPPGPGGFNGGGYGYFGSGGGASDVRHGADDLDHRVLVAGGGGAGWQGGVGGAGGGASGGDGTNGDVSSDELGTWYGGGGTGGTATGGGAGGSGPIVYPGISYAGGGGSWGTGATNVGPGGGGGLWGGGGGGLCISSIHCGGSYGGAGGGSAFVPGGCATPTDPTASCTRGVRSGHGSITLTFAAPPAAPNPPMFLAALPANASAVVGWYPPADNGSPVVGYVVTPYIGTAAQPSQTFASTATAATVTGLTNGTTYTFKVAAYNGVGTGPTHGATKPVTVGRPDPPAYVTALTGNAQAHVGWFPPADNGAPITQYVVTPYIGTAAQPVRLVPGSATGATVTGLTNGVTYTFRVAARNSRGIGITRGASNPVTVGTPDPPGFITAKAGNGQVALGWFVPADNGSPITAYVVTPYIGSVAQPARTIPSLAHGALITGLTNGTTYTFRVAAVNAFGQGAPRGASNAVTPTA